MRVYYKVDPLFLAHFEILLGGGMEELFNRYVDDAASRHHCAVRLNDLVQLIQLTLAKTHYDARFTRLRQIQNPCRQLRLSLELPPAARHAQERGRRIDEYLRRCVDAYSATSREYKTSDPQGPIHPAAFCVAIR